MSHKPDPNKSVNLTIDGLPVTVPEGTRILEAAKKVGVHIPVLCEHPELCKRAVCRICTVECDGRGKLLAACASDVWEGVNVVTHNARLVSIRKTIIELILANHPQECLNCIRNKNCELQSLAANYGIRESSFRHDALDRNPPVTESMTIVRDMNKCVKCGRCVETCQEVQTVRAINSSHRSTHYEISAPYGESPADGSCVFCGQCAEVCPVGAIYEHDQGAETWAALGNSESKTALQFDPAFTAAFDVALGLPPKTVTPGKLITAFKRIGFDKVFSDTYFADTATAMINHELMNHIKQGGKLPMISGCSQGWTKFVENFYGDLLDHVHPYLSSQQVFGEKVKSLFPEKITAVSVEPCLAKKYKSPQSIDLVLTIKEAGRMFLLAGINFIDLPESPFDTIPEETLAKNTGIPYQASFHAVQGLDGVEEAEVSLKGSKVKLMIVHGLASARKIMDSIRRGECDASFVEIMCCPGNRAGCRSISSCLPDALSKLDKQ